MNAADRDPARLKRRLALLVAAPTLVVALGIAAVGAWRVVRPPSPFDTPLAYSLGDAIAQGDLLQAYGFIHRGQDPNDLIAVRDPVLTGGRSVLVSPVVWATAVQNPQAVQMLLAFGVRMDRAANRKAVCLAEALRNEDIVRVLRRDDDGPSTEPCREIEAGDAPLLRTLSETQ